MKNKKKFRERKINCDKPFLVIKDLNEEKKRANNEQLTELNNIEKDLNKVLEYYDKRKKIQIPKGKISEKNGNNLYINNNIIYKNDSNENANSNNDEYKLNYTLKEYQRPNNYIIYSSLQRNKINATKKEYEAKEADFMFLNIRGNFMKIEDLENIIADLENNVVNNKDDKIDVEKAKQIIETKYSNYKNYTDKIINHFKDRRQTIKNSLIRKNWRKEKTFQIRKTDKIKTRKNTQNTNESLNKIIDAEQKYKTNVLQIINSLYFRECLNKHLLKIDNDIFQTACEKIKGMNISADRIKESKMRKENVANILKILNDKKLLDNTVEKSENNDEEIINNDKDSNVINSNNVRDENNGQNNNNIILDKTINDIKNIYIIDGNQNSYNNNIKIINERKNHSNKNNFKNKNEIIFPPLTLDILKKKRRKDSFINKNSKYRVRIRLNRANNITVDRYIEEKNDLNPFHDSFNKIINNYKKYTNKDCQYNHLKKNNFENLFNCYNLNYVKSLPLDESDDDSTTTNNDAKQLSNSFKQFQKLKRAHNL